MADLEGKLSSRPDMSGLKKPKRKWPPETDEDCYLEIKKRFNFEENGLAIAALFAYSIIFLSLLLALILKSLLGG